jgi:hypothetical protein
VAYKKYDDYVYLYLYLMLKREAFIRTYLLWDLLKFRCLEFSFLDYEYCIYFILKV